jgi:CheY-like chemotaxis protein
MPQTVTQHILIVDDESQDVALFRRILERGGYSVTGCNSGRVAIRAIKETVFDLVILDLNIPDMDGFEVLKAVRHVVPRPRVLVVSGFMQGQFLATARLLGAAAVLDKSVAVDLLLPSVDKLFEPAC